MRTIHCRTGVRVHYLHASDTKPGRYSVHIDAFPNRIYSEHLAPDTMDYTAKPQFFAQRRLDELNLGWQLAGACYMQGTGFVFTTK